MPDEAPPLLIQGGMGVNVSNWRLARAVALAGQAMGARTLGVVSGTGLSGIIARRLQDGDQGGHLREAFQAFPFPEMAARVWKAWHIPGGKAATAPYRPIPMVNFTIRREVAELIICANFAEVWLAKQGHDGPIGINYLEKIQTPRLPEVLGAMLAGVDAVLMGAGIPYQVPSVLDSFAAYETASYALDVEGAASAREFTMRLDPASMVPERCIGRLQRPRFYAVVATHVLAQFLCDPRRTPGRVDGFVVEGPTAGGHNAPPRNKSVRTERGEPVYGDKDAADLTKMRELGRPFWLAGAYARPEKMREAVAAGAAGCQLGSVFALCAESGMREDIKRQLRRLAYRRELDIVADPLSSPSGYPFNVVQLSGTVSDPAVDQARARTCDVGYLRHAYKTCRGTVACRCPAEPVATYVARGGDARDTTGRKCLCNGLAATGGLPQLRPSGPEPPIVTLGRDTRFIHDLMENEDDEYSAADAVRYLLGG